ncbi:MAG: cobalamin biosynthesis protein CobD [Candidatus Electrothrix sp. AR4]|nr:cobalamin biosynthesis protein CobD [Candidatus Electrothrix sp. AR4]
MSFVWVLITACALDFFLGDPRWFPHPVRIIAWFAVRAETVTRKLPLRACTSGRLTVLLVLLCTGGTCAMILTLFTFLPWPVSVAGTVFMLYTTIAARDLIRHARQVFDAFAIDLQTARKQVAMIVGRDTEQLDEAGIIRACVESVAENMSDGIIAPLFWAVTAAVVAQLSGGEPIFWGITSAMLYKAVNTMDSMFGYKNEQYLQFGFFPARLDDLANFFPARLSGIALVLAAPLCRGDMRNSWHILRRDRRRHTSPNAGWPEAAMAGALGLQLGGDACYFGTISSKPTLGAPLTPPEQRHILLANTLVLTASLLSLLFFSCVCLLVFAYF